MILFIVVVNFGRSLPNILWA